MDEIITGSSYEAFAEERTSPESPPGQASPGGAAARAGASHEGMVSVGGTTAVFDTTRRRVFDVHVLADEIRIFEDGALVATHAPSEGRGEKRLVLRTAKPAALAAAACATSP